MHVVAKRLGVSTCKHSNSDTQNMRRKGVADARKDQAKGLPIGGKTKYEKGKKIHGHHRESVSKHKEKMTDPRVIDFLEEQEHINFHRLYGNK